MTVSVLEELGRRLSRSLAQTRRSHGTEEAVIFGPGERRLAQVWADQQSERVARQGIIAEGAGGDLRRAAVLIPLVARPHGITVLLTRRTPNLAVHAGQISFPGGRLEPEDRDARAAALRETAEEIGLFERHIQLVGELEEYGTVTGFRVTPVVGIVTPPFSLTPDPTEVAEIFEVPLDFILDPTNRRHAVELRGGVERDVYEIVFARYRIWGFTARLLVRLVEAIEIAERLEPSDDSPAADRTIASGKD